MSPTEPWVEVPFEVQKPQAGLRVDRYLTLRLHRYSRSSVRRLIDSGQVFLRGRPVKPAARVAAGETVLIRYPRRQEGPCRHQALPILYEDDDLLAVDKPGDLLSHPTDKVVANSATSVLRRQFRGLRLHLLHRLDRETSGVLLLAKNPKSARALTEQFSHGMIRKEYLAIARGRFPWRKKTLDLPLGREGLEIKVRQKAGTGRPALTEFLRLDANDSFSLLRALPRTGRLHQIRAHLAHLGHPVLGDKLYTGDGSLYLKAVRKELTGQDLEGLGAGRQMLHARLIRLRHPVSGRPLAISAPPPADFMDGLIRTGLVFEA